MKICMLAPEFPPVWGGVGTYVYELTRHLPKSVEVHILTPQRESFGAQKIANGNNHSNMSRNLKIHYISSARDSFLYNYGFQYACLKSVPKIIKDEGIEVIHSHQAHMPDLLLLFRNLKCGLLTTVHTTIKFQRTATVDSGRNMSDLEDSEKATYYLYPFLRVAEELYIKKKRHYTTPSLFMAKWLSKNFPLNSNVKVIPNCVDLDYSEKPIAEIADLIPKNFANRRIILYAGRLLALKGVDTIVRAIPKVLENYPKDELMFVFAGPGDPSRYRRALKSMNINYSNYLFLGSLPRERLVGLIKNSELSIVPSYNENCPYAVLESMACGTPVVASNVGGIPEIITDNIDGALVEAGDSEMLANAIVKLLSDGSLRKELGRKAKTKVAQNFSWQVNIPKYLKCYSDASGLSAT